MGGRGRGHPVAADQGRPAYDAGRARGLRALDGRPSAEQAQTLHNLTLTPGTHGRLGSYHRDSSFLVRFSMSFRPLLLAIAAGLAFASPAFALDGDFDML